MPAPSPTALSRVLRAAPLLLGAAALPSACKSQPERGPNTPDYTITSTPAEAPTMTAETLDALMIVGPTAARGLGYRIDWESGDLIAAGRELRLFEPAGDALFVIDSRNEIARVRTEDGVRTWIAPVGDPVDNVLGISRIAAPSDRVYVLVEGAQFVLDAANGGLISRDKLARAANTRAIQVGNHLVYGGRTGEIVWLDFRVGHPWRVNAVNGAMKAPPVLSKGDVVAASTAGEVIVMDGRTARTIWTKPLLDGVAGRVAAGDGVVFVAGLDQYLWALDQGDGHTVWKYFTDAPLTGSPTLIEGRLYQRIPSEGLVAFDAFPADRPDGKKIWVNKETKGEVIGRRGKALMVWDDPSKTLSLLDDRGFLMYSINVPKVHQLVVTKPVDGDLFAASRAGRFVRLVPN